MKDDKVEAHKTIYIVTVQDNKSNVYCMEAFSNQNVALDYEKEMLIIYHDLMMKDGWSVGFSTRILDVEHLDLATEKNHIDKINDSDWGRRFNTQKFGVTK